MDVETSVGSEKDRPVDMTASILEEASDRLRRKVSGFRALAMVSLDGSITDHVSADASVDSEMLEEFATLLRIAYRTSEDARAGELRETCWISDQCTVLTRRVSDDTFLIFVGAPQVLTGLARYVLKQAAWQLHIQLEGSTSR
jgi:predicted regulator of Ras-like GTPase activity (Roadblock/LC7/MglB family)